MSWNYRVVRKVLSDAGHTTIQYGIHEVYYDDDHVPTSCTVNPVTPYGESEEELAQDVRRYTSALEKPVLDYDSFGVNSGSNVVE
jgi:hypothetical protein